jgi:branched-chain amino acid transport system ATP-binding protein
VLHNSSIEVASSEIVALLGANGAGKSSLVMTCMGVHRASGGTVKVNGQSLIGLSPNRVRAHGVAVVPEGHRVLSKLTVRENLEVVALHLPSPQARLAVDAAIEIFPELKPHLGMAAGNLSGGQKQMVAISQALAAQLKILLIDELSLGLAQLVIKRLVEALKLIASGDAGILLVEQFTTLALSLASRTYLAAT